MSFSADFDSETRMMMTRVLDEACREVRALLIADPLSEAALRDKLASRIAAAVRKGERDPKQLKLIAMGIEIFGIPTNR